MKKRKKQKKKINSNIISRFFKLSTMGHWWVMIITAILYSPWLIWPGIDETTLGKIYFLPLGFIISVNMFMLIYKFIREVISDK
jgi:hypothetical protein